MGAPVTWFEVATATPKGAEGFYGGLFDWSFQREGSDANTDYTMITTGEGHAIGGGIAGTRGKSPNHAIFYVQVDDVAATCAKAEDLGGKVLVPATTAPDGLTFAHLRDRDGSTFGVWRPPQD